MMDWEGQGCTSMLQMMAEFWPMRVLLKRFW